MIFIDARSTDYDMDVILNTPNTNGFYITDTLTLNTPYNKGVTGWADSTIYSYTNVTNFGYQVAYMAGSIPMMRTLINGTISDWTTGFLPLTGGTLSGIYLLLNGGSARIVGKNGEFSLYSYKDSSQNQYSALRMYDASAVEDIRFRLRYQTYDGSTSKQYYIFGEHNKPTGSYTGNGSATSRTISTGGIGKAVLVMGNGYATIVTQNGSFSTNSATNSVNGFTRSEVKFDGAGSLILYTSSAALNRSGTTYIYQVL